MTLYQLITLLAAGLLTGCALSDSVTEPGSSMTYSRSAYRAGRVAAQRDLEHGILATESSGLPARWYQEYVQLLRRRYGIEDRSVAGCIVNDKVIGHMRGYNEVSNAVITRRFGSDVFDRTAKEAQALYQKRVPYGQQ